MRKRIGNSLLAAVLALFLLSTAAAARENSKLVALTFDDGPSSYTELLLDGLNERGAKATFFVQGFRVEEHPETVRRMIAEGHQVGNHSYDHPNLSQIPLRDALLQLFRTNDILDDATGGDGGYAYRAPYGSSTKAIREKMDAPFLKWSVDTVDWSVRNTWRIQKTLIEEMEDGAIVLCHDTVYETVDAVLGAVDQLQQCGYEFVTVNELYRRRGQDADAGISDLYSCPPVKSQMDSLTRPLVHAEIQGDQVTITLEGETGVPIYYTLDGSPIVYNGTLYTGTFTVTAPCTLRAVSASDLNGSRSEETMIAYVGEQFSEENDTRLSDHAPLTRGMLAQLLYEMEETRCVKACALFEDVSLTCGEAEAVTWAYAAGLFEGTGADTFEPDRKISREEVAKVLSEMFGLDADGDCDDYIDAEEISPWAQEAVAAVTHAGLMQGSPDGSFDPHMTMTGYECKLVLERIEKLDS